MNNVIWVGLADAEYYSTIAQYCLPSWTKLPGKKYVIHDSNKINIEDITVVSWDTVVDNDANFLSLTNKTKPLNFWRKMQSQVWAARNLLDCEFLVLLDTDIEVLDFDQTQFNKELAYFNASNLIWATGESNRQGHDSGFIILKINHPELATLIDHYENIWESGDIFQLAKWYDGHAVESMFLTYPSYKVKNRDYGSGLHVYDLGLVHYGSKIPKALRSSWQGDGKSLVEKRLGEIVIKKYKGDT